MSERFVASMRAVVTATDSTGSDVFVRAVDVPQIVKAEVERALAWYHRRVVERDPLVGYVDPTQQYVSSRFGEPEKECRHGNTDGCAWCGIPERWEPTANTGPRGGNWPLFDGLVGSCRVCRCAECAKERASLAKLERFCTALAKVVDDDPSAWPIESVRAAREYLR